MKRRTWTKVFVLAGVAAMAAAAHSTLLDATVLLERAANSRTLTVRYTGTTAALAELRLNGKSLAVRSLDDARAGGETSFPIDTAALEEGDHEVEVRLYNADGKVVAVQTTKVKVDRKGQGPIFIERPIAGATVRGPVEIRLGFRQELSSGLFVSYFVNDKPMSLSNLPPYSFLWDTEREKNGWHEVQAWVVDKDNNTYRTDKLRLFVNNPGGRTNRVGASPLSTNAVAAAGVSAAGVRGSAPTAPLASGAAIAAPAVSPVAPVVSATAAKPAPAPAPVPLMTNNPVEPAPAALAGTKSIGTEPGEALGTRNLRPIEAPVTAIRVAGVRPIVPITNALPGAVRLPLVSLGYGSRIQNDGPYQIQLDDRFVNFDVNPRVMNGVPFTPFRHLFQEAGGTVHFEHTLKKVYARGMGRYLWFSIGDDVANVDGSEMKFELAPFIENSRVLVPMSFMVDALRVKVQYDPNTGHVLIQSDSQQKG